MRWSAVSRVVWCVIATSPSGIGRSVLTWFLPAYFQLLVRYVAARAVAALLVA